MQGGVGLGLFLAGWAAGWLLLARPRALPAAEPAASRPTVSVVIPARDEERSIGRAVESAVRQLREGDEVLVVDDHSHDRTATVARAAGARVFAAPDLPPGWAGKPHACSVGAAAAGGEVLVFVDADVTLGVGALDAIAALSTAPGQRPRIVSVQPWHRTGSAVEQLQLCCNLVALMGCVAFTALGRHIRPRVAFGPVLACTRDDYLAMGGHGHPDVRGAILEDIALARRAARVVLHTGRAPTPERTTAFRMYPGGWRPMVEGWTKGMGIGASATPPWAFVLVAAWVASLAAGWLVSPWLSLVSAAQVVVLARVAGRWSWWAVVLFPVPLLWFVGICCRSAWRRVARREVSWKGRQLTPDQPTR